MMGLRFLVFVVATATAAAAANACEERCAGKVCAEVDVSEQQQCFCEKECISIAEASIQQVKQNCFAFACSSATNSQGGTGTGGAATQLTGTTSSQGGTGGAGSTKVTGSNGGFGDTTTTTTSSTSGTTTSGTSSTSSTSGTGGSRITTSNFCLWGADCNCVRS